MSINNKLRIRLLLCMIYPIIKPFWWKFMFLRGLNIMVSISLYGLINVNDVKLYESINNQYGIFSHLCRNQEYKHKVSITS